MRTEEDLALRNQATQAVAFRSAHGAFSLWAREWQAKEYWVRKFSVIAFLCPSFLCPHSLALFSQHRQLLPRGGAMRPDPQGLAKPMGRLDGLPRSQVQHAQIVACSPVVRAQFDQAVERFVGLARIAVFEQKRQIVACFVPQHARIDARKVPLVAVGQRAPIRLGGKFASAQPVGQRATKEEQLGIRSKQLQTLAVGRPGIVQAILLLKRDDQ